MAAKRHALHPNRQDLLRIYDAARDYEASLLNGKFRFLVTDNTGVYELQLAFNEENFAHLVGIRAAQSNGKPIMGARQVYRRALEGTLHLSCLELNCCKKVFDMKMAAFESLIHSQRKRWKIAIPAKTRCRNLGGQYVVGTDAACIGIRSIDGGKSAVPASLFRASMSAIVGPMDAVNVSCIIAEAGSKKRVVHLDKTMSKARMDKTLRYLSAMRIRPDGINLSARHAGKPQLPVGRQARKGGGGRLP